jgi:two-component system response regulator HydG
VDYVSKPFDPDELVARVIGPIAERRALRKKFDVARQEWVNLAVGLRIVAASAAMSALVERLRAIAASDWCVLLHGERGSGRKTLARLIHEESPRRQGPYVVVPCEALVETMIEAEVGGLAPGAACDGWLRQAEGGTLVLDGVDRLPQAAQSTLARVLAEPTAVARRGPDWQPRGIRVVATAESDLFGEVTAERFLESLYFRLSTVMAAVPPLREREEDLLPLIVAILSSLSPSWASPPIVEPSAYRALSAYRFPGNVSELAWALKYAFSMADAAPITAAHLPPRIAGEAEREAGAEGLPM